MPDKTPRPAFTSHETIYVPPDTLRVRRETTTASMLGQPHTPTNTNTAPFRGFGLYTHAEIPKPQDAPRFAHQKYLAPSMQPTFLPLGGPQRVRDQVEGDEQLPKEVLRVHESLKSILLKEEEKEKNGKKNDHSELFEHVGLPDVWLPPPPSAPPPRRVEMVATVIQGSYRPAREQRGLHDNPDLPNEVNIETIDHEVTTLNHTPEESREILSASGDERIQFLETPNAQPSLEIHDRLPEHTDTMSKYPEQALPDHVCDGVVRGKLNLDTQPSKSPHSSIVSNAQDTGEILEPTISNDREADIYYCFNINTQESGEIWDDIIMSTQETVDIHDEMFSNTQDTEEVPDTSVNIWVPGKARRDDHDTNARVQSQEPISPSTTLPPHLPDLPQPAPEEATPVFVSPNPFLPEVSVGQGQIFETPEGLPVTDTPSELHLSIAPSTETESRPAPTTLTQSQLPTTRSLVASSLHTSNPQEDVDMEVSSGEKELIETEAPVQRAAYKKARLTCNTCKMGLTDLNNLVAHMVKRHTGDLGSTYFRCCASQSFNGQYTSSSPHWRGVHGWSERPFKCPDCDVYFPSIIGVSKHWKQTHIGPTVAGPDASSKQMSKPREGGLPAHPKSVLDQQQDLTTNAQRNEEQPLVAPITKASFASNQLTFQESATSEAGPNMNISTIPDNPLSKPFQNLRLHCITCSEDSTDIPSLTKHVDERHLEDRPQIRWTCCDINTPLTSTALNHFSDMHGWRHRLPCPSNTCDQTFDSLPQLQKHVKTDHSSGRAKDTIACRRCQRWFPTVGAKDKHECARPPSRERPRQRSRDWSRRVSRRSSTSPMDTSDGDHWDSEERMGDKERRRSSGARSDKERRRSSGATKCSFCGWDTGHSPVCMYR